MITRLTSALAVAALAVAGLAACGPKQADGPAEGTAKSSQSAQAAATDTPTAEPEETDEPTETEAPTETDTPADGNKVDSIMDLKNEGDYYVSEGGITYRFSNGGVKIDYGSGGSGGSTDLPWAATPSAGSGGSGSGGLCDAFPEFSVTSAKAFLPYVSASSVEDIDEQLGYLDKVKDLDGSLKKDMVVWKQYLKKAKAAGGGTQKIIEGKLVTDEVRSAADRLKAAYRACP